LRREEVAQLAGISVDYYVRFEQGRIPHVSDAVLDALVRILGLTPTERSYLFELTRTRSGPRRPPASDGQPGRGLLLLLTHLSTPAFVLDRRLDVLAVNRPARLLHQGLTVNGNYLRWLMLDSRSRNVWVDWDVAATEVIAMLRLNRARHSHDGGLVRLVDELATASREFRRIWDAHEVDAPTNGERRFRHALVGDLVFHAQRLEVSNDSGQVLFTYSVIPGSDSEAGLRRLVRTAASTTSFRTRRGNGDQPLPRSDR
jgi:transcriptional regulator with XRE-family HTH domain